MKSKPMDPNMDNKNPFDRNPAFKAREVASMRAAIGARGVAKPQQRSALKTGAGGKTELPTKGGLHRGTNDQ